MKKTKFDNFLSKFYNPENEDYVIFVPKKNDEKSKKINLDSKFVKAFLATLKIIFDFFVIALIVMTIVFLLINSIPGENPILSGKEDSIKIALTKKYHLDDPLLVRYGYYLANFFKGDFGVSFVISPELNINEFIWTRFFNSFLVGIFSVFLTLIIGIPLGIWVGKNPGKFIDIFTTVIISILTSVPSLVFGIVLLIIAQKTGMPFIFDWTNIATYILPGLALSLGSIIIYIKYIRTEMNNELNSTHAKFAYLKSIPKSKFVFKHAIKPSLFPIATFFPALILGSFIGSIFVERIFQIPGSGALLIESIQTKDYNVLMFLVTVFSLMTILSFTLRDVLYSIIDPRIRRGGKR